MPEGRGFPFFRAARARRHRGPSLRAPLPRGPLLDARASEDGPRRTTNGSFGIARPTSTPNIPDGWRRSSPGSNGRGSRRSASPWRRGRPPARSSGAFTLPRSSSSSRRPPGTSFSSSIRTRTPAATRRSRRASPPAGSSTSAWRWRAEASTTASPCCGHPATTPSPAARWASASSTTSRSRLARCRPPGAARKDPHRRLGPPSRQRHAALVLGGPERALFLDAPVPVLSGHGRDRRGRRRRGPGIQRQRGLGRGHGRRGVSRGVRPRPAADRSPLRARLRAGLVRFRRGRRRSTGRNAGLPRRLRRYDGALFASWPAGGSFWRSKAATTSMRSRAPPRRACGCSWAIRPRPSGPGWSPPRRRRGFWTPSCALRGPSGRASEPGPPQGPRTRTSTAGCPSISMYLPALQSGRKSR